MVPSTAAVRPTANLIRCAAAKAWDLEAFRERAKKTMALGRGDEPEEIVGAALHFAASASSFTTRAVLGVHGGAV